MINKKNKQNRTKNKKRHLKKAKMKLGHVATGNCPHAERSSIFRWGVKMTQRRPVPTGKLQMDEQRRTHADGGQNEKQLFLLVRPLHDELCAPTASRPENSSVT